MTISSPYATLSRVRLISIGGDSFSDIPSSVENSIMIVGAMVEVEDVAVIVIAIQGEDVDTKIRIHVIMLNVVEIIIHQVSAGTSSVNLSGLRLLILHLHPV